MLKGGFAMTLHRYVLLGFVLATNAALAQQPAPAGPIDRVKITDNELSCTQIHGEIGDMETIVAQSKTT